MEPATAPVVSSKSISAPGTIAPVASATTPCSDGDGGGAGEVALAANATQGRNRVSSKAKERIMRNLQGSRRLSHGWQAIKSNFEQNQRWDNYPTKSAAMEYQMIKNL
jgi:hypothetical protein